MAKLKDFVTEIERQIDYKVKRLWFDDGGEYDNKKAKDWLKSVGIQWKPTVAYTPKQNKVSERLNRTLMDCICLILHGSNLDMSAWGEVGSTVI